MRGRRDAPGWRWVSVLLLLLLACAGPQSGWASRTRVWALTSAPGPAIGGDWGGAEGIDDAIFPQRMEVDYVRVYQRAAP